MNDLGILSQPFLTNTDILFLTVAGWTTKDLQSFPPDVIRALIKFELKREETVDRFRKLLGKKKTSLFYIAFQEPKTALAV